MNEAAKEVVDPETGEVTDLPGPGVETPGDWPRPGELGRKVDPSRWVTAPPAKLYAALVKAQAVARAVRKDAENKWHKYSYASAEAVIEEAKECFAQAGLALLATNWSLAGERDGAHVGRIFVHYRLVHEGGEALELSSSTPVITEKGRPADKAELGALTANLSYTLRGLLLLPREDASASIDGRDDRDYNDRDRNDRDHKSRDDDRGRERREPERRDERPAPQDRKDPPREPDSGRDKPDSGRGSFPPTDDGRPPAEPPQRIVPRVLVDDAIDGMKRLEAEFGLGGPEERRKAYAECEQIPPRLLAELGADDPELDRARTAYKTIIRGMRAALGIQAPSQGAK